MKNQKKQKILNKMKNYYWEFYKFFYDRPHLSRHFFRPIYKLNEIRLLRRIIKQYDIDCVFDVGANIGQYATMLRKEVGFSGTIVSFEPNPNAFAELNRKAAADRHWVAENIALSDVAGELDFNIMVADQFSSLQAPTMEHTDRFSDANTVVETVPVRVETLATALPRLQAAHGFERPFLKMDTQGHDAAVVRGGGEQLATFLGLQSELSIVKIYEGSLDYMETIRLYESLGFRLCALPANNRGHFPMLVEVDCLMLRADLMKPGA